MKLTDAVWEKRNLGLTTAEITVELGDTAEILRERLPAVKAEYQVAKAPHGRMDLYFALQEQGFAFSEASIRVSHEIGTYKCPPLIERLLNKVSYEEMPDLVTMEHYIRKGMFQTDRVILDPFFTSEQAAERYIGWMRDEQERGARLFHYTYQGAPIGFSCMRGNEEGEYYPVLGGIYPNDKPLPFGMVILYKQLDIARDLDGKRLYTYISSNNLPVVKAYNQCGYSVEEVQYVFVKHEIRQ